MSTDQSFLTSDCENVIHRSRILMFPCLNFKKYRKQRHHGWSLDSKQGLKALKLAPKETQRLQGTMVSPSGDTEGTRYNSWSFRECREHNAPQPDHYAIQTTQDSMDSASGYTEGTINASWLVPQETKRAQGNISSPLGDT